MEESGTTNLQQNPRDIEYYFRGQIHNYFMKKLNTKYSDTMLIHNPEIVAANYFNTPPQSDKKIFFSILPKNLWKMVPASP